MNIHPRWFKNCMTSTFRFVVDGCGLRCFDFEITFQSNCNTRICNFRGSDLKGNWSREAGAVGEHYFSLPAPSTGITPPVRPRPQPPHPELLRPQPFLSSHSRFRFLTLAAPQAEALHGLPLLLSSRRAMALDADILSI